MEKSWTPCNLRSLPQSALRPQPLAVFLLLLLVVVADYWYILLPYMTSSTHNVTKMSLDGTFAP